MILKERNGVSFFRFPNLARFPDIRHWVFTRNAGYSRNPYRSLNISFCVGDNDIDVELNRRAVSQYINEKDLVYLKQTHGTEVLIFAKNNKAGAKSDQKPLFVGDAMITDIQKKFLVVQAADCQSILMYDPVRRVVANVHSGWRGSINNIAGRTIEEMKKNFGCNSCDIIAGIGPSLGPCCAEFINYKKEIPAAFWKYKDDFDHFDFWSLSCDQLCDAGVLIENIYSSKMCTRCNTDLFFSFRREGATGRFASVIGLRD